MDGTGRFLAGVIAGMLGGGAAYANPDGAQVMNGQVAFAHPDAATLNVTNTPGAIIHWNNFSVGAGETTRFIQQGADSAVLNRVVGANPSDILGNLLSNGRVYLINPSGIVFGPGAHVDTAGLIASTLNMTDADFLAGRLRFEGDANAGAIVNQGYIKAGPHGEIVLIAPRLENSGIIEAPDGRLLLAAGQKVSIASLDFDDIHFDVQAPEYEVVNLGKLIAEQGAIGVFAGSIRHSGTISADSINVDRQGRVVLSASSEIHVEAGASITASGPSGGDIHIESRSGTTTIAGAVETKGTSSPPLPAGRGDGTNVPSPSTRGESTGKGGTVHILGSNVALLDNASVEVSGEKGGGTALIGGDFHGANPEVQNATATYIGPDSIIKADATVSGDGGKVAVWSDDSTQFYGAITARGGAQSGNGGFVETSSKNILIANGMVDTSAPLGSGGQWLLDPSDVTVVSGSANSLTGGLFDPGTSSSIGDTQINAALNGGTDVTIQTSAGTGGSGDITVNSTVAILNSSGGARSFTLNAGRNINIQSGANIAGTVGNALSVNLNATGTDTIGGTIDNRGGTTTLTGTTNTLTGTLRNGTLMASTLNSSFGTLEGVTLGGNLTVGGSVLSVSNNLVLANGITLSAGSTQMNFNGTESISSPGTASLTRTGGLMFAAVGGAATLTIGSGITLSGATQLTDSSAGTVLNNGTLDANTAGTFTLNPTTFTNNGTLRAANGGTLSTSTGFTSNAGVIDIGAGSTLTTNNNNLINSASGIIRGNGNLNLGAGRTLTNNGTLRPGASPGFMTITGNLALGPTSVTDIEINGLARGQDPGYDAIHVTGTATLDGTVNVIHLAGFTPNPGDSFQVLDAAGGRTGTFATINAPVTYNAQYDSNNAILQAFTNIPVNLWITDSSGDWGTAANWDLGVPVAGQIVLIDRVTANPTITVSAGAQTADRLTANENLTISGGTLTLANASVNSTLAISGGTLTANGPLAASTLNLSSGTLNGTGNVTVNGTMGWTGGNMLGTLTIPAAGVLNISSGFSFFQGTIDNSGTVNWSAGELASSSGTAFSNAGTVNVNAGTLSLAGGGSDSGAFAAASGATLSFSGGTHTFNGGTDFNGTGTIDLATPTNWGDGFVLDRAVNTTSVINLIGTTTGSTLASGVPLLLDNQTLTGTGILNVAGTLTARRASAVNGTLNINAGGTLAVEGNATGNAAFTVGNGLTNSGTVTLTNTDTVAHADTLTLTAGSFTNKGTVNVDAGTGGGARTLTAPIDDQSAGTLNINTATTVNQIAAAHTIAGNLNVTGGDLTFQNQTSLTQTAGTVQINAGRTLTYTGGAWNWSGGALSGSGNLTLNGGATFNLTGAGARVLNGLALSFSAMNLTGGSLDVQGGTLNVSGATTIGLGTTFTVSGGTFSPSGSIDNSGTYNLNSGSLSLTGAMGFNNLAGATFNLGAGSGGISFSGTQTFNNAGTFNMNSSGLITVGGSSGAIFNNTGMVNVNSGTLSLLAQDTDAGGALGDTGSYNVSAGATARFRDSFRDFLAGSSIAGAGNVQFDSFSGGVFNIDGTYNIAGTTIVNGNMTVNFNTPVVLGAPLHWSNGIIGGSGSLTTNGVTTLDTAGTKTLNGLAWDNNGTVNWTDGGLNLSAAGSVFNNQSGGLFNARVVSGFDDITGAGTFNNLAGGTFNNAPAAPAVDLNVFANFTNAGTVNITDVLHLERNFSNAGVITLQPGGHFPGGSTLQAGPSTPAPPFTVFENGAGGTIQGIGTIDMSCCTIAPPIAFTNRGIMNPGFSPGTITVNGDFVQAPTGSLTAELGGLTQGVTYDLLAITGNATLAGTLNVSLFGGFTPAVGNSFDILTYAAVSGDFATLNFPAGFSFTNMVQPSFYRLDLTAAPVVVAAAPALATPGAAATPVPVDEVLSLQSFLPVSTPAVSGDYGYGQDIRIVEKARCK